MPTESITLMEQPNRVRDTVRTASIDRFYEIRGMPTGISDFNVMSRAEGLGFPKIGDNTDHNGSVGDPNNPQPCFDRGLITLLGPHAEDNTQGAILFARYGFLGGGGSVQGNQASATSANQVDFTQPYFFKDDAGYFRTDISTKRTDSNIVYSGIVLGQYTAEVVRGEITAYSGTRVKIRFAQLIGPDLEINHFFRGARLDEKPGQVLRYAAVFSTSGQVQEIPNDAFDSDGVGAPFLDYLDEYVVRPARGTESPIVNRFVAINHYPALPNNALLWVTALRRA